MKKKGLDDQFMMRCIQLAEYGAGNVSPNPMVGAVIVHHGIIIGEGYHRAFGGPHAEVHAIASVQDKTLLKHSELYVNLEPCSHHGKTPPCSELIIQMGIPKVYVGCADPFIEVAGQGIAQLRAAGIEVQVGLCEQDCLWLNRRFITSIQKQRPYILLKWAESQDGFIGLDSNSLVNSQWITSDKCRYWVHRMRAEEDAILIGTNTALVDNPELNIRYWSGKEPYRVILDRHLRLPSTLHTLNHQQATLVYTEKEGHKNQATEWIHLHWDQGILSNILSDLYHRNIRSLVVEGGTKILESFIQQNLWDEAYRFVGEVSFGSGVKAPQFNFTGSKHPLGYIKYENFTPSTINLCGTQQHHAST